jgi:cystine transport system permease protein
MSVAELLLQSLPYLLKGALITLWLSFLSIIIALVLGLFLAVLAISGKPVLQRFVNLYVSFFRGTPLLVQLFIVYFGFASFVRFTPFQAALIGISLHFGAYISESFRGAIQSIAKGQWEASSSLGLSNFDTFRRVIFPQAWRRALPSVWNSLIDIVKSTSLASVVTVEELTNVADQISSSNAVVLPVLLAAAAIYWGLTSVLDLLQKYLEFRYRRAVAVV